MLTNYKKTGVISKSSAISGAQKSSLLRRQLDEETLSELREAFNLFDTQRSGEIDARELKAILRAFGVDLKKDQVLAVYREIGKDKSQGLTFAEFTNIIAPRLGQRDSKEEIERIFQLFDEDKSGRISFTSLKKIARDIGEEVSDEELYEMIEEADRDGDGCLNFAEFYRVMKRREDPLDDYDSDEE